MPDQPLCIGLVERGGKGVGDIREPPAQDGLVRVQRELGAVVPDPPRRADRDAAGDQPGCGLPSGPMGLLYMSNFVLGHFVSALKMLSHEMRVAFEASRGPESR